MSRSVATGSARAAPYWGLVVLVLLGLRLPAIVEPAGNDQSLYMYVADQVRHGGVPYVDAWDQKPPAIFFLYAAVRSVWAHQSAVAIADVLAAGAIAALLFVVGRRTIGGHGGGVAAAVFTLFSHPSLGRLSGVYLRGQCEVFIALAVTTALALSWRRNHRAADLVLAGVALGVAFWLKYNALAYAVPLLFVLMMRDERGPGRWPGIVRHIGWVAGGALTVSAIVLFFFAAHGALGALWLATIDYNLRYSSETYTSGAGGALRYAIGLPLERGGADMLWFLGLTGAMCLAVVGWRRHRALTVVVLAWLAASLLSILVNGARNLPQYFVQAAPALALACAAGLTLMWRRGRLGQAIVAIIVVAGLWRVGVDPPSAAGFRWAELPQLADNIAFDVSYLRGRIDKTTFLARFKGAQKYDATAVDALASYVVQTTKDDDRILVFGFAPAVYLQSHRSSASRFFWSRPVVVEFASDDEGYGSRGLLADLTRTRPAVIALQKQDWGPMDPNSEAFFLGHAALHAWLVAEYELDRDTPIFSVWRRRSS
ncbi:MAG: hypothetical protein ABI634_00910 [Acidobacteriota bacterium]